MNFLLELTKLILPLVGLLVSIGVAYAAQYLRQRSKNEVINRVITSTANVVQATVLEAQQTVVDGLKKKNGGKLTEAEKEKIKSDVLKSVKARLTDRTLKELQGVTADLEGYLSSLIESHVYINKDLQGVLGGK
jgi:hypothetical protein